ncbi:MAG: MarR family winged helix-turn-helix transcriptional regulator [Alphaproteobacteria bacterium]
METNLPELDDSGLYGVRQCTCWNLRKASRAVSQMYDSHLKPSGLLVTQFSLLAVLSRTGPIAMNALAAVVVADRTTLTRNLRPLERVGMIRSAPGEDRRVRLVSITKRGAAALAKAMPLWRNAQEKMVERLGERRCGALLGELQATVMAALAA